MLNNKATYHSRVIKTYELKICKLIDIDKTQQDYK